jgi:lipopolysaccharide export system ATP-binding protein
MEARTRAAEIATPRALTRSTLSVENLQKRYGSRAVVKDVSLTVESGEVVGLLGPNGAGKTTCFYMVVGLVPLDDGDILVDGKSISHLPIHRRARLGLSYLPQEASVFRKLTVEENIRAVLELQLDDEKRPLPGRLSTIGCPSCWTTADRSSAHQYRAVSLGRERRRSRSRARWGTSALHPARWPFAGVDPIAVLEIQRIVRFLKDRGIGVLITDHNVRETLGICDHAYIINEGVVLAAGRPEEIVGNETVRRVYLGEHFRM